MDQHIVAVYAVAFGLAAGGVFFNHRGRLRRHPGLSGAAIRLYRDTFRRLGLLGGQGQGEGQDGQGGDGQPTGKAGERFKVACGCQPHRSFWIRAKQYTPGPITCGVCGQDFQPQNADRQPQAG